MSISVISEGWKGEHEKLCALKRLLGSERIPPAAGFKPGARDQKLGVLSESYQNILKKLRDGGNGNSMPEQCRTLLYIYKVTKDDSKLFKKLTLVVYT